jgi:asparagine N-glycosylation enzyme membrane subunit Stt3
VVEIALVAASTLAALLVRVLPPWRRVFAGGEVWFQENDPWYHVRVAEAWIAGFPHRLTFDPYLQHPGGGGMPVAPFLDLLLAFPASGHVRPSCRARRGTGCGVGSQC